MKKEFQIGDIVKIIRLTGSTGFLALNTYHKLLKSLERDLIGIIGRADRIEKDYSCNKIVIRIVVISNFNHTYKKIPLTLFPCELAFANGKEKKEYLKQENEYMQYDLARRL